MSIFRHEIAVFVRSLFLKIFAADVVIERHHADNTPVCDLRRRIAYRRIRYDRYHISPPCFSARQACRAPRRLKFAVAAVSVFHQRFCGDLLQPLKCLRDICFQFGIKFVGKPFFGDHALDRPEMSDAEFDRTLRNITAALAARAAQRPVDSVTVGGGDVVEQLQRSSAADFGLRGELPYIDAVITAVNDESNMLEKERKIDMVRWEMAGELAAFDYFNIGAVLSYLAKINIVARWSVLDPKRGREIFERLMAELDGKDDRTAQFRTAIALILKEEGGTPRLFEGVVTGSITKDRRGGEGFGYDPIFRPDGYTESFAELGHEVKNKISHRARAVAKLVEYLKGVTE